MGAYTGFEKISWTNKQRPRKSFSRKKRLPDRKSMSTYESFFKLQPSKNRSEFYIGLGLLLVILLTVFLHYNIPTFTNYQNRSVKMKKLAHRADKNAYHFLMNSGKNRLSSNNLLGAYSEFKLAQAIYPQDDCVNQVLIDTLARLCNNGNAYCDELDNLLVSTL